VRRDEISWITGESEAGQIWLNWTAKLQTFLNRRLFLGLFSFESHFAHYPPGAFYKRHYDAFHGQANRILSIVVYLNPHWPLAAGGELVLYRDDRDVEGIKVTPALGTIVTFLSEEFPHEVLPATQDRYSIAGWFRLNTSINNQIDPSR
jgi:SM-20-related protein